jgi:hypothetical protein
MEIGKEPKNPLQGENQARKVRHVPKEASRGSQLHCAACAPNDVMMYEA